MAQGETKKEALFNEVKGSLFEYLVGREISVLSQDEISFQKSLDVNYLTVLSQQDRMVRQFYPEMTAFLSTSAKCAVNELVRYFGVIPTGPRLLGKFINSSLGNTIQEADLSINVSGVEKFISLKLNKRNAYVNTKSGGIKSFFSQYFPFLKAGVQEKFNSLVEMEFETMSRELHAFHDMNYSGNFTQWVKAGLSELPGELSPPERAILKSYYARIAQGMHLILSDLQKESSQEFSQCLASLMGFTQRNVIQLICFNEIKSDLSPEIQIHELRDHDLMKAEIMPFNDISSVELNVGGVLLQIRVKPMNKFTTTAIKMNCSVKRPSVS